MSLAAGAGPSPLWYLTRATGVSALVLLTVTLLLGVLGSLRFSRPNWPRFLTAGLHRNVSLLVLVFVGLHVMTTVLDTYAPIGWPAALVPFTSGYRPLWLGLGTVAFDLLLALAVTSLLRVRLGLRMWRVVHWTAYVCWPVAVLHALGTGTDATGVMTATVTAACLISVVAAVAWRLVSGWPAHPLARAGGVVAAAGAVAAIGVLFVAGPMQPGWAKRAGTPAALLAHGSPSSPMPALSALPAVPFTTSLSGTLTRQNTSDELVAVTVRATGGNGVTLRVVITGSPADEGGVRMGSSEVALGTAGQDGWYTGHVTGLAGTQIRAAVNSGSNRPLHLDIRLTIQGATIGGSLAAAG